MQRAFTLILMIICLAACRLANPEETILLTDISPAAEETQVAAAPIVIRTPFVSNAVQPPTATSPHTDIVTSQQTTSPRANTVAVQNIASACQPRTDWYEYTIVSGDTLYQLASRTSTTVDVVVKGNCLVDASVINVNQVILLPVLLAPGTPVEAVPAGQQTSNGNTDCTMTLYAIGARLEAYNGMDRFNSVVMDTMTTLFPGTQMPVLTTSEYRIEVMMPDGRRGWIERYMGRLDGACAAVQTVSVLLPVPGAGCYMRIDTQADSTGLNLREQPDAGAIVATFPNATWVETITFGHPDAYELRLPDGRTGWIASTERIQTLGMRRGDCNQLPVYQTSSQSEFDCQIMLFGIGAPHVAYDRAIREGSVRIATGLQANTTLAVRQISEYRTQVQLLDGSMGWIESGIGGLQGDCDNVPRIQTVPAPPETGCHIRIDSAATSESVQIHTDGVGVGALIGTLPDATWVSVIARGDNTQGYDDARQIQLVDGRTGWLGSISVFTSFGMTSGNCNNLPVVGLAPGG
ncbi:MAG: LysM peptidoglycan-binding domain-containing protein [Aggregatilineales bacterium]